MPPLLSNLRPDPHDQSSPVADRRRIRSHRRPQPDDVLGNYIEPWTERDGCPDIKFGGPREGRSALFRLEFLDHLPVLVLTEGEWDAMLLWKHCADLCDIGTIGGTQSKFDTHDLVYETCR